MKSGYRLSIIICSLTLLWLGNAFAQNKPFELLNKKEYTKLENLLSNGTLQATKEERLIIQAILANVFGTPQLSNNYIAAIDKFSFSLPDSLEYLIQSTRYDNDVKLFHYSDAFVSGSNLLNKFANHFTPEELQDEKDALVIWEALKNEAPQQMEKNGNTRIYLKRDLASLWNIPVQSDTASFNFVFDTGAGISVITESYVDKLHIRLASDRTTPVKGGLTGIPTVAHIGIAEKLSIGNITVHNVVFLVFPDSALSFAGGAYKINGIIGFPVIKEFGEITIAHDTLSIPQVVSGKPISRNMAIDQLLPIVYMKYGEDVLPFTFDTGAHGTLFSEVFFARYESFIKTHGKADVIQIGGSSGSKKINVYKLPVQLTCFDNKINLPEAEVSLSTLTNSDGKYYGNLGQDIIKQFSGMTISFKYSYIDFF